MEYRGVAAGAVAGCRRSGIRTNLHAISLLTGNLTGKIAALRLGQPALKQETAVPQ
jgi:hypothetical protein